MDEEAIKVLVTKLVKERISWELLHASSELKGRAKQLSHDAAVAVNEVGLALERRAHVLSRESA
jgi:hypothetical protein